MSLLPARFQTSDDMPMSLGKAIARAIAPKVDPNAWFDAVGRECPDDKPPRKVSLKDLEQDVFEDWLRKACPSGDVEAVQNQWENSAAYEDFWAEHEPAPSHDAETVGDGWVKWGGGKCPLSIETRCEAQFASGEHWQGVGSLLLAGRWLHECGGAYKLQPQDFIVAYKVIA